MYVIMYSRAMTETARAVFEAHATTYEDDLRRRLIPPFDAFYGTAVEALGLAGAPLRRVLDLGAGTGLLSVYVAAAHPGAELVLVDGSPAMLDRARERLAGGREAANGGAAPPGSVAEGVAGGSFTLHVGDLRDPFPGADGVAGAGGGAAGVDGAVGGAVGGGYDAIVSALAIHHLDDGAKRDLYARAQAGLRPGGVFVNAEQVRAPSPDLERSWRDWHREASAALGTTPQEWAAAEERMAVDRCATVADQLDWLRAAGFADADCHFKWLQLTLVVGTA
jgi:tRNA (cmo5U34)-methyltransferase